MEKGPRWWADTQARQALVISSSIRRRRGGSKSRSVTAPHQVHQTRGIPLILTNGWPSCFAEFLPLVPRLTDPAAHGIDGPGFDVVIPSLPGYGFSDRPERTGVTCRYTAGLWHRLMRGLGYQRYGAHGGDFGSAVTTFMALDDPGPMLGIHLSGLDLAPYTGPGSRPLSAAEQAYLAQYQRWRDEDRGYGAIQSTRPQTLSYGLNDSRRPGCLGTGEMAGLGRLRRGHRRRLLPRLPAHRSDLVLGHPDDRVLHAGLRGQPAAGSRAEPGRRGYGTHRGSCLSPVHRRRHPAPRVGRTSLQHPPVDAHAPRRPLPVRRATRPAQPRHRSLLQQPRRGDQPAMTRSTGQSVPAPGRYCNPESKRIFGDQLPEAGHSLSRCVINPRREQRGTAADLLGFADRVRACSGAKERSVPLRPAWTSRSISELPTAPGVAVRCTGAIRDAMGREGGCLQDWLGIADASEFAPCRFLRHEWALRDMMAAMPTLGGGPA